MAYFFTKRRQSVLFVSMSLDHYHVRRPGLVDRGMVWIIDRNCLLGALDAMEVFVKKVKIDPCNTDSNCVCALLEVLLWM